MVESGKGEQVVRVLASNIASMAAMAVQGFADGEFQLEDLPGLVEEWVGDVVAAGALVLDWGN